MAAPIFDYPFRGPILLGLIGLVVSGNVTGLVIGAGLGVAADVGIRELTLHNQSLLTPADKARLGIQ